MAKNDVVLLDGIIDERLLEASSTDRGEVFEQFALEQLLKDYDLSSDEIESGWVDGENDGGIDGAFIFVNGHLLEDGADFVWPRSSAAVDIWLLTVKHHATFQQAPLDAMLATIQELLDLALEPDEFRGKYSPDILAFRALLLQSYRRLSIGRPTINFHFCYVSRGDTSIVGESVRARAQQIESTIAGLFSNCGVSFQFVGASELVETFRRLKRFALELPFVEHLATGKDSYVLLVRLRDYAQFVTEDNGQLRRYLFDSNVRDFLGVNQVNEEIEKSLADPSAPDFWWLNNGVTILATNATVPGKTIQLQDIQIVNGLQTTETVFRHFIAGSSESNDRSLLIKVIVSSDTQVRDRIIRATNNQSPVEVAALHATDRIQRDIEEILERHGWYYERRKNYYRNIGKPQARFVTPVYLASAVIALVFKNPARATRLKPKFMRTQIAYEAVFSEKIPIETWPALVEIYKRTDSWLSQSARERAGERFISKWRPLVALIAVATRLGTFAYPIECLQELAHTPLSDSDFAAVWEIITAVGESDGARQPRYSLIVQCCKSAAAKFGLLAVNVVGIRGLPTVPASVADAPPLPVEFVAMVDTVLPAQPWKIGVHNEVAEKLDCKPNRVSRAIQELIAAGKRSQQKNGIVYRADGQVVMVDPERVPYTVAELHASGHRMPEDFY
jgi:hypothetical protein